MNPLRYLTRVKDRVRAYQRLFAGDDGLFVLRDLASTFHLLNPAEGPTEEGQRQVVLYILTQLRMTEADLDRFARAQPLFEESDYA